ncbi:hypothetical protein M9H77_06088 [Catharanthus roseus]|uniref:Uncharacterized protein n=1 Tax=Catharanthus roseus TaxID=4058 RepID=A0ACC0BRB4_CATRO|nr:hypothetical protein M9H77_06088 [Catharanthus roseus]
MALKSPIQFPILAPTKPPSQFHRRPATEIRFSRWNNANAEKFNRERRTQKEIEDQLRFQKRFDSALNIANNYYPAPPMPTFKSTGTPSSPSRPSIPGKKSKYSKDPQSSHPAFRPVVRKRKIPVKKINPEEDEDGSDEAQEKPVANVKIEDKGLYYEFPDAPFLYQYSYTETPKVKPVAIREPLVAPFEPATMGRPWTGRKPLPPSKKKLPEFDSFQLPPPHKKGVKPVQAPGPYLPGTGPKYVKSREEEKTGGKIIFSRGGVVFLFRGRNYNHKYRPRYPLMLWKPASPVYPRLIKRVPEGLTLEEATEMRKKGRELTPICKLGKNGVYSDLVKNVREAFEECELVRINCQGVNGSDYRKIGAKLKDLVPCVLISFEHEHILMWRGRDWKSSLPELENDADGAKELSSDTAAIPQKLEGDDQSLTASVSDTSENQNTSTSSLGSEDEESEGSSDFGEEEIGKLVPAVSSESIAAVQDICDSEKLPSEVSPILRSESLIQINGSEKDMDEYETGKELDAVHSNQYDLANMPPGSEAKPASSVGNDEHTELSSLVLEEVSENRMSTGEHNVSISPSTEEVLLLRRQAVESGSALLLDGSSLDADIVYQRAVALADSAPPGPTFRHRRPRKLVNKTSEKQQTDDLKVDEAGNVSEKKVQVPSRKGGGKKVSKPRRMKDIREDYLNVVPRGSLGVDELAKLLS